MTNTTKMKFYHITDNTNLIGRVDIRINDTIEIKEIKIYNRNEKIQIDYPSSINFLSTSYKAKLENKIKAVYKKRLHKVLFDTDSSSVRGRILKILESLIED